ncbi:rRNA maturation RNase YbeY [Wolbachia endosymbiont of Atemnus politus]|uniref:rRNA maturation RNase YbeY n=1 Tax=Wolbachia endosymbiont of Atemnus politus TaxID=2682840 RepID=UPI001571A6B7|nr:rRNA maturation RNase YbeY [Wolbachia endosymbiont of Atemnus politus]NSM56547.1 rRNA maturation RNase YbeY [Wolbachia endosymbiont of Atemnus politus]NSX83244.1 rRNA maturation RNase YbeY [Wolbachia endosymbiont of Atemnus politus]
MLEVNVLDERWHSITEDPEGLVLNIISASLQKLKIDHYEPSISVVLANDNLLHQLNLKFRKMDKPTNVLSFQCEQLSNKCDLGDIAISIDTIRKESDEYHIPIIAHIAHMLVHGLLHLLGYDHQKEDEEIIMKNLEGKILASLGYNYVHNLKGI